MGYVDQVNEVKIGYAKTSTTWSVSPVPFYAKISTVGVSPFPPAVEEAQPLPESMCGNCRRDWHDFPLTEVVARMWNSVTFSEDYDPESDDSRVVCPGSECCGPAVSLPARGGWGYASLGSGSVVGEKITFSLVPLDFPIHEFLLPWTFESLPDIAVSTWLPGDEGTIQQAALEAAPKAIEHKPPVSPGFDFSGFKDVPGHYQAPKRKRKK
jgi:hypothetical protein